MKPSRGGVLHLQPVVSPLYPGEKPKMTDQLSSKLKKQSGKRKRVLSSYEVFVSFVDTTPDGRVDVTRVLSKECFQTWLISRSSPVKHPEQSFQRTLTAHLRGADGRRPFPPAVESELLKVLRGSSDESPDSAENPWNRCFGQNQFNVGVRGFSNLGYHEKSKLNNSGSGNDNEGITLELETKIKRKSRANNRVKSKSVLHVDAEHSFSDEDDLVMNETLSSDARSQDIVSNQSELLAFGSPQMMPSTLPNMSMFSMRSYSNFPELPPSVFPSISTLYSVPMIPSSKHPRSHTVSDFDPDARIPEKLFRDPDSQIISAQLELVKLTEENLTPQMVALLEPLSSTIPKEMIRDFVCPKPFECRFDPHGPVGIHLYKANDFIVLKENNTAIELLGRSCLDLHLMVVFPHPNGLALMMKTLSYVLLRFQRAWSRFRLIKGDGSVAVFLLYGEIFDDETICFYFQNVSDDPKFQPFIDATIGLA